MDNGFRRSFGGKAYDEQAMLREQYESGDEYQALLRKEAETERKRTDAEPDTEQVLAERERVDKELVQVRPEPDLGHEQPRKHKRLSRKRSKPVDTLDPSAWR